MKELSLNVLDIAENSFKAKASLVEIILDENDIHLTMTVRDDGCGMDEETVKSVLDPFYTTRTTRKVGLGLPLLKMAAEQTGGSVTVSSQTDKGDGVHGTEVCAVFNKTHLDYTPLGDVAETVVTLIQGHPETEMLFQHSKNGKTVLLDTRQLRAVLGDVPLNVYEVITWIREYLREQYESF